MVTVETVCRALDQLGIAAGDLVLVHSSLRSLGPLENGPQTVIEGFEQKKDMV